LHLEEIVDDALTVSLPNSKCVDGGTSELHESASNRIAFISSVSFERTPDKCNSLAAAATAVFIAEPVDSGDVESVPNDDCNLQTADISSLEITQRYLNLSRPSSPDMVSPVMTDDKWPPICTYLFKPAFETVMEHSKRVDMLLTYAVGKYSHHFVCDSSLFYEFYNKTC
jgi:hypothetical protein